MPDTRSVSRREEYEAVVAEVERRALAGETNAQIAAAVGKSRDAVSQIRRKLGLGYWRILQLTAEQHAAIDERIVAGDTTRAIAADFACHQGTVARRGKALRDQVRADRRPCACGKPHGHGGRCLLSPDKVAHIRQRLIEGAFVEEIARELGLTAPNIRENYARPIFVELAAAGVRCGCGQELGHNGMCEAKAAGQRVSFSTAQRERADELCRAGVSAETLADDLGIALYSARILISDARGNLALHGVPCPCGKPVDHQWSCSARDASSRTTGRRDVSYGATSKSFTPFRRRRATKLAKAGWGASHISRQVGESVWRVKQLMNDLIAGGVQLAATCPGCDGEARHKGPCPVPKRCECGRWRYHRGACRSPDGRKNVPTTMLSPEQVADLKRRYRHGASARAIGLQMGVSFSTVQRFLTRWRSKSRHELKPCICGRPARHPGGCIKNTPGALHRRWDARISELILAGRTVREVADDLQLGIMTVTKRAGPARAELLARGTTCPCGKPLGHRYWCSETWDRFGLPRGHRPIATELAMQIRTALLNGDKVAAAARLSGASESLVWRVRQELSLPERQRRARVMRDRAGDDDDSAYGVAMLAAIKAAVGRGIESSVRDEVIAELYLAVIEGRLELEQIKAAAASFVSRGYASWASRYGPRSLDERLGDDDTRTMIDFLEDDTAIGEMEMISIGDTDGAGGCWP